MRISIIGHDQISPRQYLVWHKLNKIKDVDVQILSPRNWHSEVADEHWVTPVDTAFEGDIMRYMMNVGPHLRNFKPDWIISMTEYWREQSIINLGIAKRQGCKIAFFRWENLSLDDILEEPYKGIERAVLNNADLLVCGNLAAEKLTKERSVVPTVRLLETGIDTDTFYPRMTDRKNQVVFPNRLVSEKGIQVFREAMSKLALRAIYTEGKVAYDQLPHLFSESKVGVVASIDQPHWQEQCCYVIGEMLSCGLPVVSTDAGSISEIWSNSPGLTLVPQNNVEALRDAIHKTESPDVVQLHGHIKKFFSNESVAQQYLGALEKYSEN